VTWCPISRRRGLYTWAADPAIQRRGRRLQREELQHSSRLGSQLKNHTQQTHALQRKNTQNLITQHIYIITDAKQM
jgi:hypothetical protein